MMDFVEVEWGSMDYWTRLTQDRDQLTAFVNPVINLQVP
jgi:hypothetical protein